MKRAGNLIEAIADIENLRYAYIKARRGKEGKYEVQCFSKSLDENLLKLKKSVENDCVDVGKYHYFKIFDPKERMICAASFDERVLHHAIMNVCHQYFDRNLIADTYATRIGKGIYKALDKTFREIHNYRYVAKLDFRKYFDSISHDILKRKLKTLFKDNKLLNILYEIIDSYSTTEGRGIPIGNLTSQYFANFYLSGMDHYIKEVLKVRFYVRYMDDMLLMSDELSELKLYVSCIKSFAEYNLCLTLKPVVINVCVKGISFLGYKVYPEKILLNKLSKNRFKTKSHDYERRLYENEWNDTEYGCHVTPLYGYCCHAYSKMLRKCCQSGVVRLYDVC